VVNVSDAVWIDVLPSMKGFAPALAKGTTSASAAAGTASGAAFGKAMLAGVAVVAGGAALAAKALFNIGSTFQDVENTIRVGTGATGEALQALTDSAKNVGKNVPASFEDVGTAIADLNTRLGLTGAPLEEMAEQFLELSRITGTDVASNIASMTRVFGDWDVAAGEQAGTLDMLFRASQATGIGVDDLAGKVVQFGSPLRAMGFSLEESAAMFGKFEKEGVNAELVVGSLRQGLGRMAKAGEDAPETFRRVVDEISGMESRTEATAAAMELFGARAGPDMAAAIQEGRFELDGLMDAITNGSDTIASAGEDTQSFSEKWLMFKNQVMVKVAPVAERVFDVISDGMSWIEENGIPAIEKLAGWLEENKTLLSGVAAAVGTAAAAFGIYTVTVRGVAAATAAWNVIQKVLNGTLRANPIGIVITVLALLVGGLILAYKKSETFRNIVDKAWAGIKDAIKFAWERVIKPAFEALVGFIQKTIIPAIDWLWKNVIEPAWAGISKAVEIAWAIIKIALAAFKWYIDNVIAPIIKWLWEKIVKPVFEGIGKDIKNVWDNVIKPVFQALGGFIEDKVAPAFKRGVDIIKSAWESIQDAARKPVNFIIETVYMNGIKKVFDRIAEAVGSDTRLPSVSPIGLPRTGGGGGGGRVLARAKGGWTPPGWTLVGEEGPELVDFRTPGRVYTAGETAAMSGQFANGDGWGGPLDWMRNVKDWALGGLRSLADRAMSTVTGLLDGMGGGTLGKFAGSAMRKAIDLVLGFASKKDESEGTGKLVPGDGSASQASLMAFGRMMQSMGARVAEHPSFGGVRGGHRVGSRHYIGRALDINYGPGGENAIEKAFFDRVMRQRLPQSYGLSSLWRAPGHFDHMHVEYDSGGWLPPGVSSVVNNTGKPEAVFTHKDSMAIQAIARGGGFPDEVTLVDADGSILTRARVVARDEVRAGQAAMVAPRRGGVR
jgi:TP901 family phage tail tape measure protein